MNALSFVGYDFGDQQEKWSRPPVDDIGYLPSTELLILGDMDLRNLIVGTEEIRYSGWRNNNDRRREALGLDAISGTRFIDFGCGIGLEALQLARSNQMILADIVPSNVQLAQRVHQVETAEITEAWPFVEVGTVDNFYCHGVLHHNPSAEVVMRMADRISSQIRFMLYSDPGRLKYVGSSLPPVDSDVRAHPVFERFVCTIDGVRSYSEWYSRKKIEYRFEEFLNLRAFNTTTNDDRYCVAILDPK